MRRKPGVAKGPAGYGGEKGREADAFERISWDEGLEFIAEKFKRTAEEFGPESILPYSYAGDAWAARLWLDRPALLPSAGSVAARRTIAPRRGALR